MTTTFKVVEFYRNNNTAAVTAAAAVESTKPSLNGLQNSPCKISNSSINVVYNILGFHIVGGYGTDIPATCVDIASVSSLHSGFNTVNKPSVKVRNNL